MDWSEEDERKIILKEFLEFDYEWSKGRKAILEELEPLFATTANLKSEEVVKWIDKWHLVDLFRKYGKRIRDFHGKYFTIKVDKISFMNSWPRMEKVTRELLDKEGLPAYGILKALLKLGKQTKENYYEFVKLVKELTGKSTSWRVLEKLEKAGIVEEYRSRKYHEHWLPPELVPLIEKLMSVIPSERLVQPFTTKLAESEFEEVQNLDNEFRLYLEDLIRNRLEETRAFSKKLSIQIIADYLKEMFGEILYFDSLLSIAQQYAVADVRIINPKGGDAGFTGFNLAFFGEPGTGKTFSIDAMIRGEPRNNVPLHGLSGRNRYCGGMTPAKFIRIGEAYEGRKFNFIVPEFNDWFKYRGMVEPLKLAMEQREIKYEVKNETVGPYKFTSFFSVNYNTKISRRGYKTTITDPNFNAIEDRMLCRLHIMSKERFLALGRSMKKLSLGELKFGLVQKIRDNLMLIYAIETQHDLVKDVFPYKPVRTRKEIYDKLDKIDDIILNKTGWEYVPFSPRLSKRAVRLASAFSLPSYFNSKDVIDVSEDCIKLALKFYIEEIATRSQQVFEPKVILKEVGVSAQ